MSNLVMCQGCIAQSVIDACQHDMDCLEFEQEVIWERKAEAEEEQNDYLYDCMIEDEAFIRAEITAISRKIDSLKIYTKHHLEGCEGGLK